MKKQLFTLFALFLIIINATTLFASEHWNVKSKGFKDVQSTEWYRNYAERMNNDGIIGGYPDGTFGATDELSVEQFITMVVRALEYDVREAVESEGWSERYIEAAVTNELIQESDFSNYEVSITRQEMSRIIVNAMLSLDASIEFSDKDKIELLIRDSNEISLDYKDDILKTYSLGIIGGYPDAKFMPENYLNRAEAAVVMTRMLYSGERIDISEKLADIDYKQYIESYMVGGANWKDPMELDFVEQMTLQDKLVGAGNTGSPAFMIYPDSTATNYRTSDEDLALSDYVGMRIAYSNSYGNYSSPTGITPEEIQDAINRAILVVGMRLDAEELSIFKEYIQGRDINAGWSGSILQKKSKSDRYSNDRYGETFYFKKYIVGIGESFYTPKGPYANSGGGDVTIVMMPRGEGLYSTSIGTYADVHKSTEGIIYSTKYVAE
ncbi:MAG: S-layer homology domain-containing protein [Vallitaleaceae bacterium]|nr:S-layer homology domain-containing protein [Vallitaleaceae bacterium]